MAEPFSWKPSELPEGQYVYGVCQKCGDVRYVTRAMMLEKVGDLPFNRIAGRLRCIGRQEPRGPRCGGPMELALGGRLQSH
jgi:hypothetical protein